MSDFKDTCRSPSEPSHGPSFLVFKAKPRVSSNWLMSSSKLQPYLELCRFVQALLKTKVVRWKVYFLLRICKKTHVQHSSNGWCITWGTQPKRRLLRLESHSYNESHPSPKAYCFFKIVDKKSFLVASNSPLTFLSSACISVTFNWVYSLVHINHPTISLGFHKCLLLTLSMPY
jgi:hypothetical protein